MKNSFLNTLSFAFFLSCLAHSAHATIYIELESSIKRPWTSCYTGTQENALQDLQKRNFMGGNDSELKNLRVVGKDFHFELFVFQTKYRDVILSPCAFEDADQAKTLQCELTLQSDVGDVSKGITLDKGAFSPLIEKDWKSKGFKGPLIDCKKGIAHVVRNKWVQSFTLADIKVMRMIVTQYRMPLIGSGVAAVWKGGSLHKYQDWSGEVQVNFMQQMKSPEVYDASVEQFSVSSELDHWLTANGDGKTATWTPWGIHFVEVKCPGMKTIIDPLAVDKVPLNMSSPSVRQHCGL
jgi:hypothetical protein